MAMASRETYEKRRKGLLGISMTLCIGVLLFAVWLLFLYSPHEDAAVSEASQTETDSTDTEAEDAQTLLAVLEGESVSLSYGTNWESSDKAVATVDGDGVVTGVAQGTCELRCADGKQKVAVRRLEQRDGCTYVDGILMVNKSYSLPKDYAPGLTAETAAAFEQLSADAAAQGRNLYIGSDFREYAYQVKIYQNYSELYGWQKADNFSARPGYSEHQSGLAIDCNTIDDAFAETPEAAWLAEHCADYGFIIRYPKGKESITGYKYEPWHIRYVGVETAKEIQHYGVTLEEYLGVDSVYAEPWQ